jgi:hypothetical protein
VLSSLGTVEAFDERSALAEAAKQCIITLARRNKLTVVKLEERKGGK